MSRVSDRPKRKLTKDEKENYANLKGIARSCIWSILNEAEIKLHKIKYYLEKRDPEFNSKFIEVLHVYKEVEIENAKVLKDPSKKIEKVTVSYDKKPGVQAIGNKTQSLTLVSHEHDCIGRDHEYKRHGTVSILPGINLHNGKVIAVVWDKHKSADFIEWLKKVDKSYDQDIKIRLLMDNHPVHTSKETTEFLKTLPNRFEFVFTPKHGSWVNIIETFFSKMSKTVPRHIRVSSKNELKERLTKYFQEINEEPMIFKWKYKLDEINIGSN